MGRQLKIIFIGLQIGLMALFSCQSKVENEKSKLSVHHQHFSIHEEKDFTVVKVNNPFPGAEIEETYILYKRGTEPPSYEGATHFIEIPILSAAISSTTHLGYIEHINRIDLVKAANNLDYFYSKKFKQSIENGNVVSIGNREFDTESLIQQEVDVLFSYAIDAEGYKRIEHYRSLGQKVIVIAEYMEKDPLIKAEWIKLFAAFTGDLELANIRHKALVHRYDSLKISVADNLEKPSIVMGFPWKGTWYVSGGKSFQAKLFADASGNYLWQNDKNESGVPLDMEVVLQKAIDADYWINTNAMRTLSQIEEADDRFVELKPFRNKQIFNNDKRLNEIGGNDYWESAVVKPDLILSDLIEILHGSGQEEKLYYYRKLSND